MTHVNISILRILVSDTQTDGRTDRQDNFSIDTYIYKSQFRIRLYQKVILKLFSIECY